MKSSAVPKQARSSQSLRRTNPVKSTDTPEQVMCIPEDNTFYMTESVFGNKELYLIIRRGAACYTRPVNTSVSGRKK